MWFIVGLLIGYEVSFQKPVITPSPSPPVAAHLTHIKDGLIGATCRSMKQREEGTRSLWIVQYVFRDSAQI